MWTIPEMLRQLFSLWGAIFVVTFVTTQSLFWPERAQRGDLSPKKNFFLFLGERKNKLDGVCITGGEPTIHSDILEFIEKIKKEGFLVKLDSNGTRPDVLREALQRKIVNFIAMDIKNSLRNYTKACGTDVDLDRIKLSVDLIRNSGLGYEFRTTVVPGIHTYDDFKKIGHWLKGSRRYVLQQYRDDGKILNERLRESQKNATIDLKKIQKMLRPYFDEVDVR